jgi:sulfide:quinone oxidoreductase
MKQLLVLGAGTAGTMVVARLNRKLDRNQWKITMVDQDPVHYYQPGFLFIPFGSYQKEDVVKPKKNFVPSNVELIMSAIDVIEPENNRVKLADGRTLGYDFLVIATGADIHPEQTPGLAEDEWRRSIHDFYSLEGSLALREKLRSWQGGRLVVNVVENPIKCPVAPLEFLLLADDHFRRRGMRDRVELVYATPLPGAFTKPIAAKMLGHVLDEKGIRVEPEFTIMEVQPDAKKIVSYDEREVEYDLLVSVPLNMGSEMIARSDLGDELNFVSVDKHTFLSTKHANVFALGDAASVPTSKAGSVAHFAVDTFSENFIHYIQGGELKPLFDGHANCFIESGNGKGMLIDFNYEVEPLPGAYPVPVLGPFSLLKESTFNHWGKLGFRYMYWYLLLRGYPVPLPAQMQMAGKQHPV